MLRGSHWPHKCVRRESKTPGKDVEVRLFARHTPGLSRAVVWRSRGSRSGRYGGSPCFQAAPPAVPRRHVGWSHQGAALFHCVPGRTNTYTQRVICTRTEGSCFSANRPTNRANVLVFLANRDNLVKETKLFIFSTLSNGLRKNAMEINGLYNGLQKNAYVLHIPCMPHFMKQSIMKHPIEGAQLSGHGGPDSPEATPMALDARQHHARIAPPVWYSSGSFL